MREARVGERDVAAVDALVNVVCPETILWREDLRPSRLSEEADADRSGVVQVEQVSEDCGAPQDEHREPVRLLLSVNEAIEPPDPMLCHDKTFVPGGRSDSVR